MWDMTGTFAQAAAILLREGLEALLVIAALGAYIVKAGGQDRLKALYVPASLSSPASSWPGCSNASTMALITIWSRVR
jgi:hypothetical protein